MLYYVVTANVTTVLFINPLMLCRGELKNKTCLFDENQQKGIWVTNTYTDI